MTVTASKLLAFVLISVSLPAQAQIDKAPQNQSTSQGSKQNKAQKEKKAAKEIKLAPAPTPKEALELLAKIKKEKLEDLQVELLEKAGRCDDPKVAAKIAPYLKDKRDEIRIAAIRALRYMKNKKAFPALMAAASKFEKDKATGPEFFLALGQHANPKAIPVLIHHAWEPIPKELYKAKIQALAHIRSSRAVAELEKLNRKFRSGRHNNKRKELIKAIEILIDEKMPKGDKSKRMAWIREATKKSIPMEPTHLPKILLSAYKKLWQRPEEKTAKTNKKRKRKRSQQ